MPQLLSTTHPSKLSLRISPNSPPPWLVTTRDITHLVEAHLSIHEHCKRLPMFVTKLGHYLIMLGITWLKQYDVAIHFASTPMSSVETREREKVEEENR
jgi:hypothetical protein